METYAACMASIAESIVDKSLQNLKIKLYRLCKELEVSAGSQVLTAKQTNLQTRYRKQDPN